MTRAVTVALFCLGVAGGIPSYASAGSRNSSTSEPSAPSGTQSKGNEVPGTLTQHLPMLVAIVLTGLVGYWLGRAKTFWEQKLNAYREILPVFVRGSFEPQQADQREFNDALAKLWLFASRRAAKKMDHALWVRVDPPNRGDFVKALQEAIVGMRADMQISPWQRRLKPEEVVHIYHRLGGRE